MIQKLESLKGKSRYINIADFNKDSEIIIAIWDYSNIKYTLNIDNVLILEVDYNLIITNAYIDSSTINNLTVFYFYFPLNTRWEDILMNNFCIGIKSATIESALYCLETISPLPNKIYVTSKKPTNLKPYKLIRSSYREQIAKHYKVRNSIERKIRKIKVIKEMVL